MSGNPFPSETTHTIIHATCVSLYDRGCLITGASGTGKSSLALSLMGLGASLVADDRVMLDRVGQTLLASAPPAIKGLIEARGVGILTAETIGAVPVTLVVDMDRTETARLPERHSLVLLGQSVPLLYRVDAAHFAPALAQMLKSGRQDNG